MRTFNILTWLRKSFSLRTAAALAIGILAATAFLEIAEEIEEQDNPVDYPVSQWLHRFDAPPLHDVMRTVTQLGSGHVLIVVVGVVAGWAYRRHRRRLAVMLVGITLAAGVLNTILKLLFQRTRPDIFAEILLPGTYSFPSGHAMAATAVYGMTAFVMAQLAPRLRIYLYVAAPLLILWIGVSRVFLGVHWPTDVLAGFAAGAILLAAASLARRPPEALG